MKSAVVKPFMTLVTLGPGGGDGRLAQVQRLRHLRIRVGWLDHPSRIKTALLAAFHDRGMLGFRAGKTDFATEVRIWKAGSWSPKSPAPPRSILGGVEGNGATVKWLTESARASSQSMIAHWNLGAHNRSRNHPIVMSHTDSGWIQSLLRASVARVRTGELSWSLPVGAG